MLQEKAKVTIELDVESAKKQRDEFERGLNDSANASTQKVEKTRDDIKKEETIEVERQKSGIAEKIRQLNNMGKRILSPDFPGEGLGAIASLIPGVGPAMAQGVKTTWKEAENMKIILEAIKYIPIEGVKEFGKMLSEAQKYTGAIDGLIDMKSKWEAIGKTVEDLKAAVSGSMRTGQVPSGMGSETFVSRLYEYNTAMISMAKRNRMLTAEYVIKGLSDWIPKMRRIGGQY